MGEVASRSGSTARTLRFVILAMVILLCGIAWLIATASRPPGPAWWYFFERWRTRDFLVAVFAVVLAIGFFLAAVSRRALFKYILAGILSGFTLVLLEGLTALGILNLGPLLGIGGDVLGKKLLPLVDISGVTREDSALRAQIPSDPIPFRFKTDRYGLRNDEDRESAQVYLLGDSFLVGGLVPFAKTVTGGVEQHLDRPVMNVSLIGVSVQEERNLIVELGLPLDSRLLIHFVYEGNDLVDSRAYRRASARGNQPPSGPRFGSLTNSLVIKLQRLTSGTHPAALKEMGSIAGQTYKINSARKVYFDYLDQLPFLLEALDDLRGRAEAVGGQYCIVHVPAKIRVLGPYCQFPPDSSLLPFDAQYGKLPEDLKAWCAANGTPFLDLTERLQAACAAGKVPYFPYDTHWNSIGHEVAAKALVEWEPVRKWCASTEFPPKGE